MWYQHQDSNAWLSPVEIINHKDNKEWIYVNRNIQKVAAVKVKPYKLVPKKENKEDKTEIVDKNKDVEEEQNKEMEEKSEAVKMVDKARDAIGAKYMKMEQTLYFLENAVFAVEVPVSEHNKPEVEEAKLKEIQNLEDYETFELVEYGGQECIGSRWVIMQKDKHDGLKTFF